MKVLHIVPTLGYGGISNVVMNYYSNLFKKLDIDFLTHGKVEDFHITIKNQGSNIYYLKTIKSIGVFKYLDMILKISFNNNYDIVHLHMDYLSSIIAFYLKIRGYKGKIISHVHSTMISKKSLRKFKYLFQILLVNFSDYLIACSQEAGAYYFGKKNNFRLLLNPVNWEKILYQPENSNSLLQEFNIPLNKKKIGHVGAFVDVKNHRFIIDVFNEICKNSDDFVLILVGDGVEINNIQNQVNIYGLNTRVFFVGKRIDAFKFYNIFDIFIFPSKNEGFGISIVEAQAANTVCVVSDSIPKICDVGLGLVTFLSLNDSYKLWSETIMNKSKICFPHLSDKEISIELNRKGFNNVQISETLLNIYRELVQS